MTTGEHLSGMSGRKYVLPLASLRQREECPELLPSLDGPGGWPAVLWLGPPPGRPQSPQMVADGASGAGGTLQAEVREAQ